MNKNSNIEQVWENYHKSKKDSDKNKLIEYYYNKMVKKIALNLSRKFNNKTSKEDLASYGVDGLYNAIERYDKKKKTKFETFAYLRIKGSMIDCLRKNDWVPRSVRIMSGNVEKEISIAEQEKGRKVDIAEVVDKFGYKDSDFYKNCKRFNPSIVSSIDSSVEFEFINDTKKDFNRYLIDDTDSPDIKHIRREFLAKILGKKLTILEKKIIYLYFYKRMSFEEIGKKLEVNKKEVIKTYKKCLKRIKRDVELNPSIFDKESFFEIVKSNKKEEIFA